MVNRQTSKISDAEWQVMNIIWDRREITSQQIVAGLEGKTEWNEKTIKTLLGRLVKKRVVGYEVDKKDKRIYYYHPLVEREQCVMEETNSFLDKFYNGALSSVLSNFVKREELSKEEMQELIDILQGKDNKKE